MTHVLLDTGAAAEDLTEEARRALELAIGVATTSAGKLRLTILHRARASATGAWDPAGARDAGQPGEPRAGAEGPAPDREAPSPLAVDRLTAPPRELTNPARDGRRLGALATEVGADLLVTWDISVDALAGMGASLRILLLGQGDGRPQFDGNGIAAAPWPSSVAELAGWLEHAERDASARTSPERQARMQFANLAAFCDDARGRVAGTRSLSRDPAAGNAGTGADARNALVFVLGARALYREHLVSTREIVCGPDLRTTFVKGRLATLNVPSGSHDLQRIIDWLPADQKPELVIVKADATGRNLPVRLASARCPRVLLVGDTHHMEAPLRRVMAYARSEPFDFVVLDHARHHGHYFVEAGFENVAWLPAFDISPHGVFLPRPLVDGTAERAEGGSKPEDAGIVFVGQVGPLHPYRTHVLETLAAAGLPLRAMRAPPSEAARLYAASRVSLNVSLNGDLNLRVFEVLAAGGCLLTDRLSPDSGLEDLFRDGEHLSLYDSDASLSARAQALLHNPDEAARIARAGHALYEREHTPAARIRALTGWVDGGKIDARWDLRSDRRACHLRSNDVTDLNLRLAAYETIQEWHRIHGASGATLGLVAWPDVDARLLVDLQDLPRLRVTMYGVSTDIDPISRRVLIDAGLWEKLRFIDEADLSASSADGSIAYPSHGFLLSTAAWMSATPGSLATLARGRQMVIATRSDAEAHLVLGRQPAFAAEGYLAQATPVPSFQQKSPVALGEIAAGEGRLEDALQWFQAALTADPEYVEALNNLGVLAQHAGDIESAASYLERAIRLDRAHLPALANLAALRQETGRLEDAEALFLAALDAEPGQVDLWRQLAQLRHQRGDSLGARAAATRAAAIEPGRAGVGEAVEIFRAGTTGPAPVAPRPPLAGTKAAAMRILVLNNIFPPQELGGYGRLMADFASYLTEAGHKVHVLTSDTGYLGPIREPETGITRTLRLYGGWKNGRTEELPKEAAIACARDNHLMLESLIESFRPDVAFVGNIDFVAPNIFAPLIERGIPVVHYLANGLPGFVPADSPRSPLYRPIACSHWLADRFKASFGFPEVGVIYPGARVDDYRMPLPPLRRRLRIAYASLVMPYKGAHVLMSALEELGRRRIDFACVIAGHGTDPDFLAHLAERARAGNLRGRVQLAGLLDRAKLRGLFARSNVLVFPSVFEEPFGISQVEAMAAGLTVVSSGTGGASEIVEHENSGLIFPSEDSERLADTLVGLPADAERWERIAEAGRLRAFTRFDMRRLAGDLEHEMLDLIEAAAARAPRPARKANLRVIGSRLPPA